jgi:hypothetical protein
MGTCLEIWHPRCSRSLGKPIATGTNSPGAVLAPPGRERGGEPRLGQVEEDRDDG